MNSSPGPILVLIGTRPEGVKLAPVVHALRERQPRDVIVCSTGQHRDLLADTLRVFDITPDWTLDTMIEGQSLLELQSRLFSEYHQLFRSLRPHTLVVQGDTASVAVASWAGFLSRIRVAHVEAGLRSGDRWQPFPEEINRRIAGITADLHFAPTTGAARHLLDEGVAPATVFVTGNTVVDALLGLRDTLRTEPPPLGLDATRPLLLVTAHRRENHGRPLRAIASAVRTIAAARPDVQVVIPVHPNPLVGDTFGEFLASSPNCLLTPPLGYRDFIRLMLRATVALTDSGGVQEEAPCLGLPVLVMREVTERPEGIAAGAVEMVGTDETTIVAKTLALLSRDERYRKMARPRFIYGDGLAASRIADVLLVGAMQRPPFAPFDEARA